MSFIIKCNKCGKEQILNDNNKFDELENISLHSDVNIFGQAYSKYIEIHCTCDNKIEEKEFVSS